MAQRLSSEERALIEAMAAAGVGVEETARRLGRHRSTVYRELGRGSGSGGYDAQAAQTAADRRARRPKTPVLAADPVLAAATLSRLRDRWSPHAASAELRAEGLSVSAETIYRACYDPTGRRGLPEGCWRLLPRRCRRRKPRGRHTRKPSPLGDFRPIADRPAAAARRLCPAPRVGRPAHLEQPCRERGDSKAGVRRTDWDTPRGCMPIWRVVQHVSDLRMREADTGRQFPAVSIPLQPARQIHLDHMTVVLHQAPYPRVSYAPSYHERLRDVGRKSATSTGGCKWLSAMMDRGSRCTHNIRSGGGSRSVWPSDGQPR